jgi:hypothetical protein
VLQPGRERPIHIFHFNDKLSKNKGVSLVLDFDDSNVDTKQKDAVDFLIKKNKNANSKEAKFRAEAKNNKGKLKTYTLLEDQIMRVNHNIKLPSGSLATFSVYDNLRCHRASMKSLSLLFLTISMLLRCVSVLEWKADFGVTEVVFF